MPTPSTSSKNTRHPRSALLAAMTLASVTLLGGCSIWPKALTFSSDPDPVAAQPTPAAPAPVTAASAPVEAQPVVTSTAIAQPQVTPAPAPVAAPVEAKAPSTAAATPASDLAPGFYINVGVFAVPANGTRAYHKLEKAGLPVFSDGVQSKKGPATRVRVGPFPTRAKADAAAKKIHTLKLEAVVFQH